MGEQIPPPGYNAQPQASYPEQPGLYSPLYQPRHYPIQDGMPVPPAQQYQYSYPAYPPQQPWPQYQMPATPYAQSQPINFNISVQNGYGQAAFYDPYRSQAITSLTCGIIAVSIWLIPFVGPLASLICAVIALINGIKGRRSFTRSGSATTGIILSSVALFFLLGEMLLFFLFFTSMLMFSMG